MNTNGKKEFLRSVNWEKNRLNFDETKVDKDYIHIVLGEKSKCIGCVWGMSGVCIHPGRCSN